MITGAEIQDLVRRKSLVIDGMKGMVQAICQEADASDLYEDEFVEKMVLISFEHKSATMSDDDEYWTAKSPFNGIWYTFAAKTGGGFPKAPVYITDQKPELFNEVH